MTDVHAVARDQLRSFIERIERLEEEKKTIADDIKDVKAEAKGYGFDVGTINTIIKLRKKDKDERDEAQHLLDTYMAALGMIDQPGFFDEEPRQRAPADRKARAALRTSEAMDDNKAFSAELVAAGLISEEAHRENTALSDAVARKYGAGVIDPLTGEVFDNSPTGQRVNPDYGVISLNNKGGDDVDSSAARAGHAGQTSNNYALSGQVEPQNRSGIVDETASGPDVKRATNSPETATRRLDGFGSVQDGLKMSTNGYGAEQQSTCSDLNAGARGVAGGESAAGSEGSHQSALVSELVGRGNASDNESETVGGDESGTASEFDRPATPAASGGRPSEPSSVAGGAKMDDRYSDDPGRLGDAPILTSAKTEQATNPIPADVPAFLTRPTKPLRPHCLRPEMCASSGGDRHCHACLKAMKEEAA